MEVTSSILQSLEDGNSLESIREQFDLSPRGVASLQAYAALQDSMSRAMTSDECIMQSAILAVMFNLRSWDSRSKVVQNV